MFLLMLWARVKRVVNMSVVNRIASTATIFRPLFFLNSRLFSVLIGLNTSLTAKHPLYCDTMRPSSIWITRSAILAISGLWVIMTMVW